MSPTSSSGPAEDPAEESRRLRKQVRFLERKLRRMSERADAVEQITAQNIAVAESMRRRLVSDLEAREEMLAELERQKLRAEAATVAKGQFIANISHEIRTPMNGIFGTLDLLSSTKLTVDQRDLLDTARTSADWLLTLINDVLDFSKIEAGQLRVESVPFDLRDCIDSSVALLRGRALASDIRLSVDVAHPMPPAVVGDPARLRQVLLNLLGNAIKFTPGGEVRLRVRYCEDAGRLAVCVEDTGVGIPSDRLQAIFDPFSQADSSTTRRFGGTGLGLSISREIVRGMDGDLWVESVENEGSTFGFFVTMPAAEVGVVDCLHHTVVVGLQDSAEQGNVRSILLRAGASVVVAEDPAAQLRAKAGEVAVLDAAAKSTIAPELRDRVVFISRDWEANELESDGPPLMIPPVGYSELLRVLRRIFEPSRTTHAQVDPSVDLQRKNHRVLVVEDNLVNQKLACRFLQRAGYVAEVAQDGAEGVERFTSGDYDVVLMDCQMPVMNGFEASRRIRSLPNDRAKVPIIAVTASAMADERAQCFEAGMDQVLTKPLQYRELARILDQVLGL